MNKNEIASHAETIAMQLEDAAELILSNDEVEHEEGLDELEIACKDLLVLIRKTKEAKNHGY